MRGTVSAMRTLVATMTLALGIAAAYADRPPHKPPQAAFDACAKAKQGDACSFKGRDDKDRKGTCEVPRDGGSALVCRPQRPNKGAGSGSGTGSAGK